MDNPLGAASSQELGLHSKEAAPGREYVPKANPALDNGQVGFTLDQAAPASNQTSPEPNTPNPAADNKAPLGRIQRRVGIKTSVQAMRAQTAAGPIPLPKSNLLLSDPKLGTPMTGLRPRPGYKQNLTPDMPMEMDVSLEKEPVPHELKLLADAANAGDVKGVKEMVRDNDGFSKSVEDTALNVAEQQKAKPMKKHDWAIISPNPGLSF